MKNSILYRKEYAVELRDVDFNNELKLSMLFSYFQEAASLAATELGVGIHDLAKENGIAWVLMRIRTEIIRMPKINETFTIETWPQKPSKLEFERDFIVRDALGEVIVRAVSGWVLMDIKERKLKRTNSISFHYPSIIEERALKHKFRKIKADTELISVYEKTVGYSDIDFNGHLNNSRYINYLMDCFPIEEHKKYQIEMIEVNFIQEAFSGDTLLLKKDKKLQDKDVVFIEGINKKQVESVFKAKVGARRRQ